MSIKIGVLDQEENARYKQSRRDSDAARLASGEISREDLARQNGFLTSLPLHEFKLTRIGSKPLGQGRKL